MMSTAVMRFGGLRINHNPKSLKIVRNKRVNAAMLSNGENRLISVFDDISKISGTAELFGSGCFSTYEKLLRLRFGNKSEILSVPELGAVRAVLSQLTLNCEPKRDFLSLTFEFKTVTDGRKAESILPYKTRKAKQGETLWDIAFELGTTVERLVELNPGIRRIDDPGEGRVVRIY